jgi:hypothetical protein
MWLLLTDIVVNALAFVFDIKRYRTKRRVSKSAPSA